MNTNTIRQTSPRMTISFPGVSQGVVFEVNGHLYLSLPTACRLLNYKADAEVDITVIAGLKCVSASWIYTRFVLGEARIPSWLLDEMWGQGFEAALRSHLI